MNKDNYTSLEEYKAKLKESVEWKCEHYKVWASVDDSYQPVVVAMNEVLQLIDEL